MVPLHIWCHHTYGAVAHKPQTSSFKEGGERPLGRDITHVLGPPNLTTTCTVYGGIAGFPNYIGELNPYTTTSFWKLPRAQQIGIWSALVLDRMTFSLFAQQGSPQFTPLWCQIDIRASADAGSWLNVWPPGHCPQDILKYHQPRNLDYRPCHGVMVFWNIIVAYW